MRSLNIVDNHSSEFKAFTLFNNSSDSSQRNLALLEQLQTSLDLEKIIDIFAVEAEKYVNFSGLYFKSPEMSAKARASRTAKAERQFELRISGNFIGMLTYAINAPISIVNYKILTELHQLLIHPINNALKYHQAMQLAMQDSLTGLGNRRSFDKELTRAIAHSTRRRSILGLILCDLNMFKIINDTHGHHVGDNVLVHFANALQSSVRHSDSTFRFGGDEFAVLVEDACEQSLSMIEHRVFQALSEDALLAKYQVSCSLGLTFMNRADSEVSFFKRADTALYSQKMNMPQRLSLV